MKNIKYFVVSILMILFMLGTNYCHAYNIIVNAEKTLDQNKKDVYYYRTSVSAYSASVDWYNNNAVKDSQGWAYNSGSNTSFFGGNPSWSTFRSKEIVFHKKVQTNYSAGDYCMYQSYESVYNGENDSKVGLQNLKTTFSGGSVDNFFSQDFEIYRMKITGTSTYTADQKIYQSTVDYLKNEPLASGEKLRFSHSNCTKEWNGILYGLDATYKFFNVPKIKNHTQAEGGWYDSDISGYTEWNHSKPAPEQSILNEYDNQLVLPNDTFRKVYVRHINVDTGARLPRASTGVDRKITLTDGSVINNTGGGNNFAVFDEYYQFNTKLGISSLRKSDVATIMVGDKENTVTYVGMKNTVSNTFLSTGLAISGSGLSTGQVYSTAARDYEDYIYVDFYYKLTPPPPPYPHLPEVSMVGKLLFDSTSSQYSSATSSATLDYIPSNQQLVPYVNDAYPYILRGVNYQEAKKTGSVSMSVTTSKSWYGTYYYWKRVAPFSETSCSDTGCVTTPVYNYEQAEANTSGTRSKTSGYSVPYEYDYYQLNNFKMYRISKVELYDSDDYRGGVLFDRGNATYTLNMSSSYENRFNQGIRYERDYSTFGSGSYYIGSNSGHCGWDSSCSDLASRTQSDVNAVTYSQAANGAGIGVNFWSTNDYVTIESYDNILNPVRKDSTVYFKNSSTGVLPKVVLSNLGVAGYAGNAAQYFTPTKRTNRSDFVQQNLTIPRDRTNGVRNLQARIYYNIITVSNYNRGSNEFTDLIRMNYADINDLGPVNKLYKDNDVNKVNVYTPVTISQSIKSDAIINQTDTAQGTTIIQKNVPFEISPIGTYDSYYNVNTNQFVEYFYVSFDFDLQGYTTYYSSGSIMGQYNSVVKAHTWIKVPKDGKIRTQAAADVISTGGVDVVNQKVNNYYIRAVAMNTPLNLQSIVTQIAYPSSSATQKATDGSQLINDTTNLRVTSESYRRQLNYYDRDDVYGDSNHLSEKTYTTTNLGRIYDFKITDCTDVNFKNVFRQTDSNGVNISTGNYFYAGLLKWNMNSQGTNEILQRTPTEIGTDPKRILPLGPYKQKSYINAPKMGYRISFDLKTTGSLPSVDSRWVEITPEYYYVSKTGQVIKDVDLYYKNTAGKYVPLAGSGYSIYYKPNDGYRYLNNLGVTSDFSNMSQNLEILNIDGVMRLDRRMMSISANTFVQAWYGEFKLPNSTIALEKNTRDLNNPLRDGYLAVKFNIVCVDNPNGSPVKLGYSYNNKVQGTTTQIPNSSQWDYEGFLGFSKAGNNVSATNYVLLQLESGSLRITDQNTYNKVKGTVLLYDLDNRAANDYE